jgi:hypothetical protein
VRDSGVLSRASVSRIYGSGIFVLAGFIVGFDSEKGSTAEGMIECIENTAIPVCTVGLLYALPATQLGRRLLREGRLFPGYDAPSPPDAGDQCTIGLNFETKRPRRDVLADYRAVLAAVYSPAAYFGRVRRVGRMLRRAKRRFNTPPPHALRDLCSLVRLVWLTRCGSRNSWAILEDHARLRHPQPSGLAVSGDVERPPSASRPFSRQVIAQIADIDLGLWSAPQPASAEERRFPSLRPACDVALSKSLGIDAIELGELRADGVAALEGRFIILQDP